MKTTILLIILSFICTIKSYSQPFFYYRVVHSDTNTYENVYRYNLLTKSSEKFPQQQYGGNFVVPISDPSLSYLNIFSETVGNIIYNCSNPTINYTMQAINEDQIDEILYSNDDSKLFIFSEVWDSLSPARLSILDLVSGDITGELRIPYERANKLLKPQRNTFFSSDKNEIYFFANDSSTLNKQSWRFSIVNNTLNQKNNLYEYGFDNCDIYSLKYGRNGKGIVCSYLGDDRYYRIYDFDNDIGSSFFNTIGNSEGYFAGNGEYLVIMYTANDTINYYHHTGSGKIIDTQTGMLIKTVSVPPNGEIYTFDNYPNDIYYVLNLDSVGTPEIHNLTQLKLRSITPQLAFPYYARPVEPSVLTVTVTGEFFTDSTIAYYNGNAKPTTFVSDSVVTINLNSTEFATAEDYPIWVSNYGSVSDTLYFSVVNTLPERLIQTFECITYNPDKTFTAHFGYENLNEESVGIVNYSDDNYFSPGNRYRGQPNVFLPGNHPNAFSVVFNGDNLTWHLIGGSLTVNKNSTPCN